MVVPPRRPPTEAPVPAPPTPMIGRERELRALAELVRRSDVRLVTLTGSGGVGKTRLALALATRATEPVSWVELAGVARAEDVAGAIASALGVALLPGDRPADALLRFLAPKRMHLVIDNFEHVLDAAPLVAALLGAAPGLTMLVTSREALNVSAEHRFEVAPLELPPRPDRVRPPELERFDGTALFMAAMRRYDSGFAVDDRRAPMIARICAHLDGLPLAIELAAAQSRFLGPEPLETQLAQLFTTLGSGPRDVPDRHRTLGAMLDWSHRLLDDELRDAFARISVFAGGATLDAIETVTGAGGATVEALIEKHLLDRSPTRDGQVRLRMLETVRAYAVTQLARAPECESVRRRHADYYLALAERTTPSLYAHGERDAMRLLDRELDNLRAALAWAVEAAPQLALHLAGRLRGYWRISRRAVEGLRWLHAAMDAAGDDAPIADRAAAELGRATLLYLLDDPTSALQASERALDLYRVAGDRAGEAEALCVVALDALVVGRLDEARRHAEAAYEHAQAIGLESVMARALGVLAPVSPPAERVRLLDEAAALLRAAGNHRELVVLYSNSIYSALLEDRPEEAIRLHDEVASVAATVGDPLISANLLGHLGLSALFSGDRERAREAFTRHLWVCRAYGFGWPASESLAGLAALAAQDDDWERAARLIGAGGALGVRTELGIEGRVEREFIAPARERCERLSWVRAERAGAAMTLDDAVRFALAERPRRFARGTAAAVSSPSVVAD